jgi:flagellar hook protein FlgE
MLGSIYTSLSGLLTFSEGLSIVSNNVTNLNTPGFKGSELQFREQLYRYRLTDENDGRAYASQIGAGVVGKGTTIRFLQGEVQQTGEDTDIAVEGNGFFILRQDGNQVLTRDGQFGFDEDGYLIARGSVSRVAGIDGAGNLVDISLTGLRSRPPRSTSQVDFINNLSADAASYEVSNVEVFDRLGRSHIFRIVFTNNSSEVPRSWLVEVLDENNATVAGGGDIQFQGNGSPRAGFNTFTFTFRPEDTGPSDITLFFGEPRRSTDPELLQWRIGRGRTRCTGLG